MKAAGFPVLLTAMAGIAAINAAFVAMLPSVVPTTDRMAGAPAVPEAIEERAASKV